ncbi:MAG: dTDP-4-dehydrorhamnose reductase [Geodermatophilaceae bacterium]|nr:dTDP-4-dehydrorhamnose reductase [Geodermatophilaceae bacterium]
MGRTRWLIVGAAGRVGRVLIAALEGQPVRTWTRQDADLTDRDRVLATLAAIRDESTDPLICINTAAVADVDGAEKDSRTAVSVNGQAPGWLAEGLSDADLMVHLSTDYVFGGNSGPTAPYDEDAPTAPLSVYGTTKRDGENAVLSARPDSYVVRTSWVFDADKPNYVTLFRDRLLAGDPIEAVTDQVSRPTATTDLVAGLLALCSRRPDSGIYHCANGGQASRYDVASAIGAELGADPCLVRAIRTDQAPRRPAIRPAYSVLGLRRWQEAGLPELRSWRIPLREVILRPSLG